MVGNPQIDISIIIPFYNSSLYIEQCVRSLMEQTLNEGVEFLFIDDGSEDDTSSVISQVCSYYEDRQGQVRIIKLATHQGVACARNVGMQEACGQYLGWCDADDWCDPTMFQNMLASANQNDADIVICYYQNHYPDHTQVVSRHYYSDPREHLQRLYEQPDTNLLLWHKILRRSVIDQYQIAAEPHINIGEDRSILVKMFCHAHLLTVVPIPLYHHTVGRQKSVTVDNTKESRYRYEQDIANTEAICQYLEHEDKSMYYLTCQYFRFLTKRGYDRLLGWGRDYYNLYRSSHADIYRFVGLPWTLRIKLSLIFSSYFSYCAYRCIKQWL